MSNHRTVKTKRNVQVSRILEVDAILVRQAFNQEGIAFQEKVVLEGSKNQFRMHEFYVAPEVSEKAAHIADEAVNL